MRRLRFTLLGLIGFAAMGFSACASNGVEHLHVHFVGKVPPKNHYRLVGRVKGTSEDIDFVSAVARARADIDHQASSLGAVVVKIDVLHLPEESRLVAGKHVLIEGRAYRVIPPGNAKSRRGTQNHQ